MWSQIVFFVGCCWLWVARKKWLVFNFCAEQEERIWVRRAGGCCRWVWSNPTSLCCSKRGHHFISVPIEARCMFEKPRQSRKWCVGHCFGWWAWPACYGICFSKCFWSVSDKGGPECMKQMNDSFWCFSFSEECMVRIMPFHQTGKVKVAEEKPEKSPTRAGVSDFKYPKWPENSEGFVFFIYRKLWSSSYSVLFAGLVRLLPEVNWWWRWVFCNHRKMSTKEFQWE